MAISQAVCNVFKMNLLKGNHDFDGGATYKIALYTSSATLGATTHIMLLQTKLLIHQDQLTQVEETH